MSQSEPTPTFDEPVDPTERATKLVEEKGLPSDNPFTDIVEDLREEGLSWSEIFDEMNDVFKIVDQAGFEEGMKLVADWQVAVVKPSATATSGEEYEYKTISAESASKAEEQAQARTGYPVDSEQTKQVGESKFG